MGGGEVRGAQAEGGGWEQCPGRQGGDGGRLPARLPPSPSPRRPCVHCAWPTRRWMRTCTRTGTSGTRRPASCFRTGPTPCTSCTRRWSRTSRWACCGGGGQGPAPQLQPCRPQTPHACQGSWVPAQPVLCPTPSPSCWEPQPSRTGSRMASPKLSSVLSKGTSKCGYSQETSKVGAEAATLGRERREMGSSRVLGATVSLSYLSGSALPPPTLFPGREKRNS